MIRELISTWALATRFGNVIAGGLCAPTLTEGDSALLLGSSKELLESTAKIVLERVHEEPPTKFPGLISRALEILKLHPKSDPTQREDLLEPVRKILGGVLQIAIEVNELRNERGTGHGRLQAPVTLGDRHSRRSLARCRTAA
ncbi:abortive infection family protein [Candidatus Poriferisodalis sp.]|uniref:abortive infection family protein n=1 Tax=Candidatus Poriferisodalis sp. TaxID=3101277 RepID=UPI003B01E199